MQDCSISSALTIEILQSCSERSICFVKEGRDLRCLHVRHSCFWRQFWPGSHTYQIRVSILNWCSNGLFLSHSPMKRFVVVIINQHNQLLGFGPVLLILVDELQEICMHVCNGNILVGAKNKGNYGLVLYWWPRLVDFIFWPVFISVV